MDKLYDVMIEYLCRIHKISIHRLHRALRKAKLKSQVNHFPALFIAVHGGCWNWGHWHVHLPASHAPRPPPPPLLTHTHTLSGWSPAIYGVTSVFMIGLQTEMGIHPDFQCNYADAVEVCKPVTADELILVTLPAVAASGHHAFHFVKCDYGPRCLAICRISALLWRRCTALGTLTSASSQQLKRTSSTWAKILVCIGNCDT